MGFTEKEAKLLSQTLFVSSSAFGLFSFGIGISMLYVNTTLALIVLIYGSLSLLGITCLPFAGEKLACVWSFAGCAGYYAGTFCYSHGLNTTDIIFLVLATVFVGIAASVAAYLSREMMAVYALTAGIASMLYIPMSIYYLFNGGDKLFLLLVSVAFIISVIVFMVDSQKVMKEIQRGQPDVWVLGIIIFQDLFDLFLQLAKLLIALKSTDRKKKND